MVHKTNQEWGGVSCLKSCLRQQIFLRPLGCIDYFLIPVEDGKHHGDQSIEIELHHQTEKKINILLILVENFSTNACRFGVGQQCLLFSIGAGIRIGDLGQPNILVP